MENKAAAGTGSLKISNDVIIRIAELAAAEIEGVSSTEDKKLIQPQIPLHMADRIFCPIKVTLTKEAAVIEMSIVVKSGYKALSVAEEVQAAVKSAVQNMTKITVSKVNVCVAGLSLEKDA